MMCQRLQAGCVLFYYKEQFFTGGENIFTEISLKNEKKIFYYENKSINKYNVYILNFENPAIFHKKNKN